MSRLSARQKYELVQAVLMEERDLLARWESAEARQQRPVELRRLKTLRISGLREIIDDYYALALADEADASRAVRPLAPPAATGAAA
jgi:hypothetical protein